MRMDASRKGDSDAAMGRVGLVEPVSKLIQSIF